MKRPRFIYLVICIVNNRKYSGSTYDVSERFEDHLTRSNNKELKNDVKKYGKENFRIKVLEVLLDGHAKTTDNKYLSNVQEKYWNNYYSELDEKLMYNPFDKPSWFPVSDNARKNISLARKKHGKKLIIKGLKPKHHFTSTYNPSLGKKGKESIHYGSQHTQDTKSKISFANREQVIIEFHNENCYVILNIKQAGRALHTARISPAAQGKKKIKDISITYLASKDNIQKFYVLLLYNLIHIYFYLTIPQPALTFKQ